MGFSGYRFLKAKTFGMYPLPIYELMRPLFTQVHLSISGSCMWWDCLSVVMVIAGVSRVRPSVQYEGGTDGKGLDLGMNTGRVEIMLI